MVKRWLDEREIEYVAKNIEHDLGALEEVKKYGFRSVPVTISGDQVIQGFAPNLLNNLIQ